MLTSHMGEGHVQGALELWPLGGKMSKEAGCCISVYQVLVGSCCRQLIDNNLLLIYKRAGASSLLWLFSP